MGDEPAKSDSIVARDALGAPLEPDDFAALDAILDDLRTRADETPQWEFCEGFMVALICCRRTIAQAEFLPILFESSGDRDDMSAGAGDFADPEQFGRFMTLWSRRWSEIAWTLDRDVESLQDEGAYQPEILDTRGALALLPAEQQAGLRDQPLPAFGQVWALGFMFAVESWPEEWHAPRDRDAARLLDESLEAIVALAEDDTDPPTVSMYAEDGPPSVSRQRMDVLGAALWAVYDLRDLWRHIGPRVPTVHAEPKPGRNEPCHCGSGKKYKKCHGAG